MTEAEEQAEQHRLRRTTRHLVLSLVAVAIFALAFASLYWWNSHTTPPPPPGPSPTAPSPSATLPPNQETLLIQATTPEGAEGNLVTAVPADTSSATLLPLSADLMVSAGTLPPEPLRMSVASLDSQRPAAVVSATTGVRIDASWRMDRKALAGLVDSVGGVPVTITRRTRFLDDQGLVALTLRPGRQRLSGFAASWYAVGDVPRETTTQSTARFTQVMTRTLRRLPDSDVEIRESLTALGALAPSTIGAQELATYLLDLSRELRTGATRTVLLPVTEVPLRDETPAWLEYEGATPLVRDAVPYALWQAGVDGPPRVLVMAPDGDPGTLGYARDLIASAGLTFVDGRGTAAVAERRTTVQSRGDRELARQVSAALGVDSPRITVAPAVPVTGVPWADVDVVLGRSYVPGAAAGRVLP
ncbi:MAG: LCP family protein [Candidatus Nanopelagicales bacterium]